MKRFTLALTAVALFAISSIPAKADWSVIRWSSGYCQIWDHAVPTPLPPLNEFAALGPRFATFGEAFGALDRAIQTRACGW